MGEILWHLINNPPELIAAGIVIGVVIRGILCYALGID